MRFSYQRDIIYKTICGVDTHPTATDVFNMVQPQIEDISLGTVYRNLSQLTQEKMILELNIDGISRYDGNMDPHQHFFCKKCEAIYDFHSQNDWNVGNMREVKEFDIQEIDIIFSGKGPQCKFNKE